MPSRAHPPAFRIRLRALLLQPAPARAWTDAGIALLVFLALAIPLGLHWGLVRWALAPAHLLLPMALFALPFPAFCEEFLFRGLLVPRPVTDRDASPLPPARLWLRCGLALFLFILWHPFNAALFLEAARPLFCDPAFLTLAGLLGIGATWVYRRSGGSLWPAVFFHWAPVVLWKLFGDGPRMPL